MDRLPGRSNPGNCSPVRSSTSDANDLRAAMLKAIIRRFDLPKDTFG